MVCTQCGELMDQTDKNSFSGRVIREYLCRKCGHTDWEDDGVALWQVLHDDNKARKAAEGELVPDVSPVSLAAKEESAIANDDSFGLFRTSDMPGTGAP